ncbi:RING-H2 finger protein ATL29 [Humulus lupulus]|uniref:RING-H2 finger protein ATL29 n=1 Tax=Humulus lupulus TaxID=3486 RepID=UPI002B412884|nr:RING-H2 finger protein ATL29 [Humulus lupulus]
MSTPTNAYYPPPPQNFESPPITIVLTIVLLIFFLLGFFSIYFCRCFMDVIFNTWHFRRNPSGNLSGSGVTSDAVAAHNGLDPALIKAFPTFIYSSVRDAQEENSNKYGLECAICLVEFENESLLRLLTVCYHVFHQECVDLWLESHKTCPVCRRDLDSSPAAAVKPAEQPNTPPPPPDDGGSVRIDIDISDEGRAQPQQNWGDRHRNGNNMSNDIKNNGTDDGHGKRRDNDVIERFSRSHSTGHSIVRGYNYRLSEEEENRYTLRLPEHLKTKLLRGGGHHWTGSCETYGDFQSSRSSNGGFGEVSER